MGKVQGERKSVVKSVVKDPSLGLGGGTGLIPSRKGGYKSTHPTRDVFRTPVEVTDTSTSLTSTGKR